jgi:hypothetical protein
MVISTLLRLTRGPVGGRLRLCPSVHKLFQAVQTVGACLLRYQLFDLLSPQRIIYSRSITAKSDDFTRSHAHVRSRRDGSPIKEWFKCDGKRAPLDSFKCVFSYFWAGKIVATFLTIISNDEDEIAFGLIYFARASTFERM